MAKEPESVFNDPTVAKVTHDETPAAFEQRHPSGDRSFFGHPRGLSTLFFTEFWERFSYYGLRAILVLFLTASVAELGLGMTAEKAGAIYGLYTACVYLMALPGGWLADNVFGQRNAVLYGAIIIACGHLTMAIPSVPTIYIGLLLIILGTGLLKPNVSSMVGELYPEGGARRDAAFSIFYMGINLGAFVAPLVVGGLGQKVNWHLGFGAAGVGMIIGIIWYVSGWKHLGDVGVLKENFEGHRRLYQTVGAILAAVALLVVLDVTGVLNLTFIGVAHAAVYIIVGIAVLYFFYLYARGSLGQVEKKRVGAIIVYFIFSAIFWAAFEQAGSSLNLFAQRNTDLVVFGWHMPASWLQSVNSLFIIIFAPIFGWLWVALAARKLEPSTPLKFAIGLIFAGLGFGVMTMAATHSAGGTLVSPLWLVLTYLCLTFGELSLSPVGLSTVTKLAPAHMVGQMMGVWFLATSLGDLIAGLVGGLFETLPLPQLFGDVALVTLVAGVVLALFSKLVSWLMSGIH